MSTITETRPAIGPAARFGRQLLAECIQWRMRRRTSASLRELDDHLLKDIGLRRDQIHGVSIAAFADGRTAVVLNWHRQQW